jgi:hypothetical protein
MTKDEFDRNISLMGELSHEKWLVESIIADFPKRLGVPTQAIVELLRYVKRHDAIERRLDEISSVMGADPDVDALSRAIDDEVLEMPSTR